MCALRRCLVAVPLVCTLAAAGEADKKLSRVVIRGLKSTQEGVVMQYVGVEPGNNVTESDTEEIRIALDRLRIFSHVSVSLKSEDLVSSCTADCTLLIEVREKWSLYPIPVYVKYRDTEIGGAFLVESNFLGRNQGFAAGGLISNRGWQGLIGFTDPHIGFTKFATTFRYLTGKIFLEDAEPDGRFYRSYTLARHDIQSVTGYQWRPVFFTGLIAGYRSAVVDARHDVESASVMNFGVRFRYATVAPREFFQTGVESTLDLERGVPLAGEPLSVISSASAWHAKTFTRQFVSLLFSFQYSRYPQALEQRLGGWQGTRTLPALLVPADQFAVSALNYQYGFLQTSWATFAALAFIDAGTARREGQNAITFWGPGAGIRMYLSEITVPALGVDVARDMLTEQVQLSFFIGYNLQ